MVRSLRERKLVNGDGKKITLMIRRLFCEECKRIHHELPDLIVPYKRHSAETVVKIISGGEVGEESRTAHRLAAWWREVRPYFLNILKSLGEKYKIPHHRPPAFREVVRAVVNSSNWIFAGRICTRSVSASRQGA